MWLKSLLGIINILRSNDSPRQLSWGVAFGMMLGFIPVNSLFNLFVLVVIYLLNVNIGMVFLSAIFFKVAGVLLSGGFHEIGTFLLTKIDGLQQLYTALYNMPIIPWTRFNNTVVLGSVAVSLLLLVPCYLLVSVVVKKYQQQWRSKLQEKLDKIKIIKTIKASLWYKTIASWIAGYTRVRDAIR